MVLFERNDLQGLITALHARGYTVIGPTVRDASITFDAIDSVDQLPQGWTDVQVAAFYRIERRKDEALFGFVVGPHSWKKYLFPARLKLFSARKAGKGFDVDPAPLNATPKYAFLGVRSCELHAIAIQDKVFASGEEADTHYATLRKSAFIIAVNCVETGGTCFCTSMNTGPGAKEGYDLALTEVLEGGRHYFVVDVGSTLGEQVIADLHVRKAEQDEIDTAQRAVRAAAGMMGRTLNTEELPQLLTDNFEHPYWDEVAKRCLSCANCTMVCPTCFCSTVEDVTDLTGDTAERWRRWDSCFTSDFTRIAGGNIRMSTRTRYRQWMTHKLSNWVEQFGTFGCVGCGRCITWCPVGIDITIGAATIRETSITPTTIE